MEQRQMQDETGNIEVLRFVSAYIRDLTVPKMFVKHLVQTYSEENIGVLHYCL